MLHLLNVGLWRPPARLHTATCVNSEEKCQENYSDAKTTYDCDGVPIEETGEENGNGLPQGHDDGENCSAKLADGVEDEELATCRAHGQQHSVKGKLGVAGHEGQ